ncbi:TetR/AcrR family transcriptional regulator [Nocardia fluminea]|uniref:TetR/AcrR family transcriptional regulator n=1 Tax=Nocardia fluminea TaxID=134984 RepID=UPI001473A902|nr:TetR/AcrR family transcriptional regulator [Nocardia fluminea]
MAPVRRRPADRREHIARASAEAFAARGLHGVSLNEIAAALDISSAAIYRHFPSKYSLFRQETLRLSELGALAVRLPDTAENWDPVRKFDYTVRAMIAAAVANRRCGALLRWQHRYLDDDDRRTFLDQVATAETALHDRLEQMRPGLPHAERSVLVSAMMSIVTSVCDHRTRLRSPALVDILATTCRTIATTTLPARTNARDELPSARRDHHDLVMHRAVELFCARGYSAISVDDIANAAGLPTASALYRYYRSKGNLLTAVFDRALDRISTTIGHALGTASDCDPSAAVTELIEIYVQESVAEPALPFVYQAEIANVPAADRATIIHRQRSSIEACAQLVTTARPDLSAAHAQILVHAALALIVDLGKLMGTDHPECSPARIQHLMANILLGG